MRSMMAKQQLKLEAKLEGKINFDQRRDVSRQMLESDLVRPPFTPLNLL
jgi:hypothetical protein